MTIFAIMAREPKPELDRNIEGAFPGDMHYRFSDRIWFVSATGTARKIADKLDVKKGGITGVVVMPSTNVYYGVASTALWDWLRARIEADGDE